MIKTSAEALKMETVGFSENLVSTYESTRRHNPEEKHQNPKQRSLV
jgi:hypothetical protein